SSFSLAWTGFVLLGFVGTLGRPARSVSVTRGRAVRMDEGAEHESGATFRSRPKIDRVEAASAERTRHELDFLMIFHHLALTIFFVRAGILMGHRDFERISHTLCHVTVSVQQDEEMAVGRQVNAFHLQESGESWSLGGRISAQGLRVCDQSTPWPINSGEP